MRANELAAETQAAQQDLDVLPVDERDALFAHLHEIERRALAQASDTAMLGSRLAQLLARQTEIEAEVRHAPRLSDPALHAIGTPRPVTPLWPAADPADAIAQRLARSQAGGTRGLQPPQSGS